MLISSSSSAEFRTFLEVPGMGSNNTSLWETAETLEPAWLPFCQWACVTNHHAVVAVTWFFAAPLAAAVVHRVVAEVPLILTVERSVVVPFLPLV